MSTDESSNQDEFDSFTAGIKPDDIEKLLAGIDPDNETENEEEPQIDIETLKKDAETGYANAQTRLAISYYRGEGIEQDFDLAAFWYKKAAALGDVNAQCLLAMCYESGEGVEKDVNKAVYWYAKAAKQGDETSQSILGRIYESGRDVPQDYKKAAYWHLKAAKQGDKSSQLELGIFYTNGRGVITDLKKAAYWYLQAAKQGEGVAQVYLARCYENGHGVTKDQTKTDYWYKKAACDYVALESIDIYYEEGKGRNNKYKTAAEWYQAYAENGEAARNYANICREADEEDTDLYIMSVFWHEQAAKKGDILSFYQLAQYYNFNKSNSEELREVFKDKEIVPAENCIRDLVNKFYPLSPNDKKTEYNDEECASLKTRIASLAETAKTKSVFALKDEIENETDAVLKTGLKMIIDGMDLSIIETVIEFLSEDIKGDGKQILLEGVKKIQKGEK